MKLILYLILAVAIQSATAGNRVYRDRDRHREGSTSSIRDRRANLDYDDIETADQDDVERFEDHSNDSPSPTSTSRKASGRIAVYSPSTNSLQIGSGKSKPSRRLSKVKDSEASGTQFEGNFGVGGPFPSHEFLNQGLVPLYQANGGPQGGNIVLAGLPGIQEGPSQIIIGTSGGGGAAPPIPQLLANPGAPPENELGEDISKPVYVFSAPPPPLPPHHPHPFQYVPRQAIPKIPQGLQKHIQLLYISPHSSPSGQLPPPPQHPHVELPHHPDLKTYGNLRLVYVLVKKPQAPAPLPISGLGGINFIKSHSHVTPHLLPSPSHHNLNHKPEVYFIRYKNRGGGGGGFGLSPSGPLEENIPGPHSSVQFTPITPPEELRGNIDYGPSQYEGGSPYDYQEDAHLSASQVLSQRGTTQREVDNGVGRL